MPPALLRRSAPGCLGAPSSAPLRGAALLHAAGRAAGDVGLHLRSRPGLPRRRAPAPDPGGDQRAAAEPRHPTSESELFRDDLPSGPEDEPAVGHGPGAAGAGGRRGRARGVPAAPPACGPRDGAGRVRPLPPGRHHDPDFDVARAARAGRAPPSAIASDAEAQRAVLADGHRPQRHRRVLAPLRAAGRRGRASSASPGRPPRSSRCGSSTSRRPTRGPWPTSPRSTARPASPTTPRGARARARARAALAAIHALDRP